MPIREGLFSHGSAVSSISTFRQLAHKELIGRNQAKLWYYWFNYFV